MNPLLDSLRSDILMDLFGESLIGAWAAGSVNTESDCLRTAEKPKSAIVEPTPQNAADATPSHRLAARLTD
jgi:hypothetical protein